MSALCFETECDTLLFLLMIEPNVIYIGIRVKHISSNSKICSLSETTLNNPCT